MIDPRVASGLRDLPPSVAIPRERMLESFRRVFGAFGFVPIETPHIERMEVLTGKGAGSDEVLRQIFEVTNKGGTPGELALRFDLTVPLARFVAKHVDELGVPFKRYAIGSVFRGERPAKGRFREFVQCDFDTVGTESALADAETALVINAALSAAGVPDFTIALNNRKVLEGLLDSFGVAEQRGFVLRALDKLGKIGREGVLKELTRSAQVEQAATSDAPGLSSEQATRVLDFVDRGRGGREVLVHAEQELGAHKSAAEGIANLRTILDLLDAGGVPERRVKIDLGLARGLDYYTGVVYETTVNGHERFGSVCSGGRYDNLASLFTSRRLPGVGASIGLDRLLALMDEAGWLKREATTAPVLVVNFPGSQAVNHFQIAARLRARGIGAEVFPDAISLGKQLGYGSSRGHKLAVIIGPDEEARRVFNLRDLGTREERKAIPWDELESAVAEAVAQTSASAAAPPSSGEAGS
ncbi:MAG TPA: histidine--tRNA ligase [Isosphaeraceae bacterium]|jgi:histidyl-tRNA synthetase|nr:histidine--tRNA ligase [Isosphaeraceae bacterium]